MSNNLIFGNLIGLFIYILICVPIANYYCKRKKMTFDWALFFLIFSGIIIGVAILLNSSDKSASDKKSKRSIPMILTTSIFFLLASLLCIIMIFTSNNISLFFGLLVSLMILFFGAGIFWINKFREIMNKSIYNVMDVAESFLLLIFISLTIYGWHDILFN